MNKIPRFFNQKYISTISTPHTDFLVENFVYKKTVEYKLTMWLQKEDF